MFTKSKFILLVLTFVGAGSVLAAPNGWRKDVDESAMSLRTANYAASLKVIDRVIAGMVEQLGAGDAEKEILATALTHKAVAKAGLGNIDEALWYWYLTQEISPAAAKSDLSTFGAPGEFLKQHPFTSTPALPDDATPPHVVKEVAPRFPAGASRFGIAGDLVVQVVVDGNGQPTLPHIVHPLPAPTLSFVALEALRHWRFQPAVRNGESVPAVFNLTVHYKL